MKKIGMVDANLLTHKFMFNGKECLIGKYDLDDNQADLSLKSLEDLGTELMYQINNSGVFTLNEMENIAMLPSDVFLSLISEV